MGARISRNDKFDIRIYFGFSRNLKMVEFAILRFEPRFVSWMKNILSELNSI